MTPPPTMACRLPAWSYFVSSTDSHSLHARVDMEPTAGPSKATLLSTSPRLMISTWKYPVPRESTPVFVMRLPKERLPSNLRNCLSHRRKVKAWTEAAQTSTAVGVIFPDHSALLPTYSVAEQQKKRLDLTRMQRLKRKRKPVLFVARVRLQRNLDPLRHPRELKLLVFNCHLRLRLQSRQVGRPL